MNNQSEVCLCLNGPAAVEFACNCGRSIVFLCKACVVTHLAEPRAHLFISLEQARALKEAKFSDKYTDNIHKYLKLRGEIQKYLPNIIDFKARIHKYREDLLEYINKKIDDTLDHLDGLESSISRKADEISEYMASWSAEGSNILLKYEQEGLGGILQEYPQQFIIMEECVKKVVDNMIFIGNDFESFKACAFLDEVEDLNEEIKPLNISNADEVEDLHQEIDSRVESEGEVQQSSERYYYKLEPSSSKLVKVDEDNQVEIEYPINSNYKGYSHIKLCELRGSKVLIVGVNGDYSLDSCTCIYDLATFACINLGSMKSPRSGFVLFYHDGKVYSFGGQKYYNQPYYSGGNYYDNYKTKKISQAEVMEWDGKEWHSLPDMNTAINNPICYAKESKIFLIGEATSEYLDLSDNNFYLIGNYGMPCHLKYYVVDDDNYIYVSTEDAISVLDNTFQYQARLYKSQDSNIRMVKFTNGALFGASTSSNCLKLHDPLSLNYRVLRKIIFRDRYYK